jgi:LuxR family transcriptional activator of bioluminescence operon/LuxR family transcriptional activator of conjugal transfer of Ti plasmids
MLTERQQAALTLAADGQPSKRIGDMLGITDRRALLLLHQARDRLGAKTIPHAVAIAMRAGLIR